MAGLELQNLVKRFGAVEVIHGVDLTIGSGEFVVFVGPSGCGKSTLLRMIAGLEAVTDGDVADRRRRSSTRCRRPSAGSPWSSSPTRSIRTCRCARTSSFGLETMRAPKAEITQRVAEAADILQIGELLDRKPGQLSGGQRQRVAIGRAIVREPKIFLFDEPLSNLDAELRMQMRVEINKLHRRLGSTMIYVTHDQVEAMTLADRIVVLRAGVVEQVGTPLELYNRPANLFVAGFIGSPRMNFIAGEIAGGSGGTIEVRLDGGLTLTTPVAGARAGAGRQDHPWRQARRHRACAARRRHAVAAKCRSPSISAARPSSMSTCRPASRSPSRSRARPASVPANASASPLPTTPITCSTPTSASPPQPAERPETTASLLRELTVKYAIVGTGSRHLMFRDAVISTFADSNDLVGLCDSNPHRLELSAGQTRQITGKPIAAYAADDFDRMLAEQKPDVVVDHRAGLPPRPLHRPRHGAGRRCHHRKADDHRHRPAARRARSQEEDRQVDHRQLQLPLRAAPHAGEGHPDVRRHRRDHRRRFPLVSRPRPRRRLFPPLAPLQGQVRRPAGPQGDPPFRPGQLVDRLDPEDRPRLRQARLLPPGDGRLHSA